MKAITSVYLSKKAEANLAKVPFYIQTKLRGWIRAVEKDGLAEVRKIPGYHDEPLYGKREGQRSIRLNRSYRAIYIVTENHELEFVGISRVHLSQLEKGQKFLSPERAHAFAKKLGYSPTVFVELSLQDQLSRAKIPYIVKLQVA